MWHVFNQTKHPCEDKNSCMLKEPNPFLSNVTSANKWDRESSLLGLQSWGIKHPTLWMNQSTKVVIDMGIWEVYEGKVEMVIMHSPNMLKLKDFFPRVLQCCHYCPLNLHSLYKRVSIIIYFNTLCFQSIVILFQSFLFAF